MHTYRSTQYTGVQIKVRPILSGRTFAGALMVAILPIDIGKSATLIIQIKKNNGKCKGKAEKAK